MGDELQAAAEVSEYLRKIGDEWQSLPVVLSMLVMLAVIALAIRWHWLSAYHAGRESRDELVAWLKGERGQRSGED